MNINTLVITIKDENNEVFMTPIYEVHAWETAENIINITREQLAGSGKTFTFSVEGSVR